MALQRNREEVVNTQLAILISTLGVTADAETIHVHGQHRPDVLFQLRGLRVVIEGKFADHPNAEEVVLEDARRRVRSGIAHIAAAVVYPIALRNTRTTKILEALRNTEFKYRIVAETHETEDWFEGKPASLMDALRHSQEALTKDDIVGQTATALSLRLEGVAKLWMGQRGACDRLSQILGLTPPKGENREKAEDRRETAAKVSALVLANAFIFQEQLALTDGRVTSLRTLDKQEDIVGATAKHWNWIWENINYVPIFQLGERVLNELPASANSMIATRALLAEAIDICSRQAALRHDLMGRIYHWLLHHAKYLGTYYTSVSAATLLLKLAIAAKWKQDFGDPAELANFKVADLACGTGTLLMATAQAISDAYIRTRAEKNLPLDTKDMSTLHRVLMENVLHGYDVLPSAVHLTASTLAMLAPDVAFVRMGLFVMPLGMDHGIAKLGSLDFLTSDSVTTQMALDYSHIETIRTGAGFSQATTAELPKLDLCVMNPRHESDMVRTIAQKPNAQLSAWLESPRGPNYGPHLWERAGRILLVERLWPITHRVLAVGFDTEILGNTWWSLQSKTMTQDQEKALLLWLNSSLALVLYLGRRVVTRSAWMQMKQPAWQSMPVLDVRKLSSKQLVKLTQEYNRLCRKGLEPLAKLKTDPIRCEIDNALSRALRIPEFPFIRDLLDREPGLTAVVLQRENLLSRLMNRRPMSRTYFELDCFPMLNVLAVLKKQLKEARTKAAQLEEAIRVLPMPWMRLMSARADVGGIGFRDSECVRDRGDRN